MTYIGDDGRDGPLDADDEGAGHRTGDPSRVVTVVVVVALVVIAINIAIAVLGSLHKSAKAPVPGPSGTLRPTAPAPSSRTPLPSFATNTPVPSPLVSSLPTPTVRPGAPAYPGALGALTAGGDVVLLDADTGRSIRTLVAHEPGVPVQDISWDAPRGIMYFDQLDGTCSTVWRYRLDFGRPERFAAGAQPVVSPDGTRVAVRGTGCGPGGAIADGLAIYAAATGQPIAWTPAPSSDTEPYRVVDFDWRPDPDGGSTALAVTLSGSGRYAYKFVDLALPAADLGAAADIPIVHNFRERFFELEYAGPQLFLAGHCCDGEIVQPTDRIVVRNVQSGVLTTLSQLAASSLTANRDGQVRYIEARPDSAGPIHTLTVRVGGGVVSPIDRVVTKESFLRIDW